MKRYLACLILIQLFRLLHAEGLSFASSSKSSLRCKSIFLNKSPLILDSPRGSSPEPQAIEPIVYDSRFFQMQLIKKTAREEFRDPLEVNNFSRISSKYQYLKTLYNRDGTHFLFRSSDGLEFTVPARNYSDGSSVVAGESILSYLNHVYDLVKSKSINKDLDSFFLRLYSHEQAKYSGYGQQPLNSRAKNDSSREVYYVGDVEGTSFSKNFIKTVRETETLVVERYDTELHFDGEVTEGRYRKKPDRTFQLKVLDEVLNFTFSLYEKKRGWSPSFLEGLREKAVQQIDMTTIMIVREKSDDHKPGKIIATMSLNRAPYGKVEFFDSLDQVWKEMYGSIGGLPFSKLGSGTGELWGHSDAIELWGSDIPILSMEQYFNRGGAFLPRPTVVERAIGPSLSQDLKTEAWFVDGRTHATPKGPVSPSTSEPIHFSSGIIYEPKNFGILKHEYLRGVSYSEILRELFVSIFHSERNNEFHMQAQRLYTYNDEKGVLLYKLMGFKPLPSYQPLYKDNTTWHVLSLEPVEFVNRLKDPENLRRRLPEDFVESFTNSIHRMIEASQ